MVVLIWDDFLSFKFLFFFNSQKVIKTLPLLRLLKKAETRNTSYIFRHFAVRVLEQKGGEWLSMLEMLPALKPDFSIIILQSEPSF